MHKRNKIIALILLLLLFGLVIGSWLDKQPNNLIAKAIKKELGDRVIWSKKNGPYTFMINDNSNEVITDIVNIVNNYLSKTQKEHPDEVPPVRISICESLPGNHGIGIIAYISNYIEETGECTSNIVNLDIRGARHNSNLKDIYNKPASYVKIKDIRELNIQDGIMDNIKASYWHIVWPDLEYINGNTIDNLFSTSEDY